MKYVVAYNLCSKNATPRNALRPRNSKNLGNLGLNDAIFSRREAPIRILEHLEKN